MYAWEKSKSKSKSISKSKFDPNEPTYSPSFLNKFNKSPKTHPTKSHQSEDINIYTSSTTTKGFKYATKSLEDEEMLTLKRASLVEKWMEKKVSNNVEKNPTSTLLEEFDLQDTSFFSSSTTNTTTSSSSDDIDYSVFSQPKQNNLATCFAPPKPKPIKTHPDESKFLDKHEDYIKNRSMAAKLYSNLKTLKQPISPGVRLTSFINSLFTKDGKRSSNSSSREQRQHPNMSHQNEVSGSKKSSSRQWQQQQQPPSMSHQTEVTRRNKSSSRKNNNKHMNIDETTATTSTCSSASSFTRSCLMSRKNHKVKDDDHGIKRTVRFCPVSVIVDDDSQTCGYKSLSEKEHALLNTKFKRSLSKRYQELKKLNELEKDNDKVVLQQKKLDEVALDFLSGYSYTDANPRYISKSHDLIKGHNEDNYRVNHGIIYAKHEDNQDDDDDGFSCSSSDLFELDHLSLIGNELPVYETTQFDNKIM